MFRQMYTRTGFEVLLDYNTYVWIAQLFILGLVVGYMRDQIRTMRAESAELEEHLSRQIVDIRDINESNVRVREVMEQQLVGQKDSLGKIYNITRQLDQSMPDEVVFHAVEMLTKLMETKDVAFYSVVNDDYARLFSASSEKARSLGNSIRYREMTEIDDELLEEKESLLGIHIRIAKHLLDLRSFHNECTVVSHRNRVWLILKETECRIEFRLIDNRLLAALVEKLAHAVQQFL